MPRLFITGLAGLLGGELAARAAGWSVAGSTFERPGPPGVEAVRLDVRDEDAVRAALRGADVVVHTAYRQDDETVTAVAPPPETAVNAMTGFFFFIAVPAQAKESPKPNSSK